MESIKGVSEKQAAYAERERAKFVAWAENVIRLNQRDLSERDGIKAVTGRQAERAAEDIALMRSAIESAGKATSAKLWLNLLASQERITVVRLLTTEAGRGELAKRGF